jgi:hypothetical protein
MSRTRGKDAAEVKRRVIKAVVDGGVTQLGGLVDSFEAAWEVAREAIPAGSTFRIAGAHTEGENGEADQPVFAAFIVETDDDEFIVAVLRAR